MTAGTLTIVCPAELAPGFRLAGAAVSPVDDPEVIAHVVTAAIESGPGVVGVYEPYLALVDPELRDEWARSLNPVVVAIPSGIESEGRSGRRARLAAMLQRAIGYHITFGEEP